MDDVRKWALCVTLCAFAGAVIYILSPKGALDKSIRTIVSLFILLAIFSPFTSGKGIEFELASRLEGIDSQEKSDIENLINEQVKQGVVEVAQAQINSVLNKHKIKNGQILIITDNNEKGSIVIKEARVIISSEYAQSRQVVEKDIKQSLGMEVTLTFR